MLYRTTVVILLLAVSHVGSRAQDTAASSKAASVPRERILLSGVERDELLAAIEKQMAKTKSVAVVFAQDRNLAVFKEPVRSTGVILFSSPDQLRWEITSPFSSLLIVAGDDVAKFQSQNGTWNALKLGRNADAILLAMDRIRSWFRGNFDRDGKVYALSITKDPVPTIVLTPKDETIAKQIVAIELMMSVDLSAPTQVLIRERTGDSTVITLGENQKNATINEAYFSTSNPAPLDYEKLGLSAASRKSK